MSIFVRLGILGGLAASITLGGAVGQHVLFPKTGVLHGVTIDGSGTTGMNDAELRAMLTSRANARLSRELTVSVAGEQAPLGTKSIADLGGNVNIDETIARAHAIGREGDWPTRIEAAIDARKHGVDVPLVVTVDPDRVVAYVTSLKDTHDSSPVSARMDLEHHSVIPEKNGRYLDAWGTLGRVATVANDSRAMAVEIPVQEIAPRVSSAFLAKLDISTVMGEYDTYFGRGGDQKLRGKNIDNAAAKLDGLVLSPGELVSFNDVVGERSESNGFQKSWEIFKGEMVEGVGGGTCQVASTFHAAIFFAGLDVLERLPHSRPSAYIPMGLDSTVVYPSVDLKVRNPFPFPVVVHTKTESNKLHVEVLGAKKPVTVGFGRELVATVPFGRKLVEQPWLSGNKVIAKQHGIRGYRIKRERILTFVDGSKKLETTTDFYPPTTEIYEVPVGFDESLLPALPDPDDDTQPTKPMPASNAVACAGDCSKPGDSSTAPDPNALQVVEAPGAHTPTSAQANPSKTIFLKH